VLQGAARLFRAALRLVVGSSRLLAGSLRLVASSLWCFQVHPKLSPVLQGVPKLIIITPMVLMDLASEIPVTLKAGRIVFLGSDTLLQLTYLSVHSTFSQALLHASRDTT
jgi:hypothetical protein